MQQSQGLQYYSGQIADRAPATDRADFLRKTYTHLAGTIGVFIVVEALLLKAGVGTAMLSMIQGGGNIGWLLVMGAFMAVTTVASRMAANGVKPAVAYGGLGLFVVAEALIFTPILMIASLYYPGVIFQAALITIAVFTALTMAVFITGKDFSFMGTGLRFAGFAALGLIVVAMFTGLSLGTWFAFGMILLMAGYILYQTSNILHHYRTDMHVPAALALFGTLATMFWYVLQLLMSRRN